MKVLLHICCGPCAIGPFGELSGAGDEVVGYFFNPNIHPLIEFRRRLKAMKLLQERVRLRMIYEEEYGLREFLEKVDWKGAERCKDCYRLRLTRAAGKAREEACDAFSSTLCASTHQNHALIRAVGEESGKAAGVEFLYRDWRSLAEEGHKRASHYNLYLQQYCGCVFSECERFKDTTKHLYGGCAK